MHKLPKSIKASSLILNSLILDLPGIPLLANLKWENQDEIAGSQLCGNAKPYDDRPHADGWWPQLDSAVPVVS